MKKNQRKEKQKFTPKPSETPQKYLRKTKKVNYAQFFSEDQDNSEEYESPEIVRQKNESMKKRSRPKSVTKENSNVNTIKKEKRGKRK